MDRAQELELIERHIAREGVVELPARRAYICNDRTVAEERKLQRLRNRSYIARMRKRQRGRQ